MSIFRQIFRKIWAFYGAIIFILEAILYAPFLYFFTLFAGKRVMQLFLKWSYYYIPRIHFTPCLIRLKVIGREKIDKKRQYIIVSNHQSILDIYANPGGSPVFFKYLAKSEVKDLPFLGKIAGYFCVFVDRKSDGSRKQSYLNMRKAIDDGHSILIYPEGTRNRSSEPLKKFHDGAFKLAIDTGVPIAVQTLVNSATLASPGNTFDLSPGTIYCHWDEPIDTTEYSQNDLPVLKEKVKSMMTTHLVRKSH